MANRLFFGVPIAERLVEVSRALAVALLAVVVSPSLAGCSGETESNSQATTMTASNVTLTAAQRENIHLYTVASSRFRKTIETTGVVDFDNDQTTSVLAPFSGPVSRLLVSVGERVKKGDALAIVDSPDFAAAVSAYSKALVSAKNAHRIAEVDRDLIQHDAVSRRENEQAQTDAVNAEADREAALKTLVTLDVDASTIKDIQQGRSISRVQSVIRSPITGIVVEKLITPGQRLQAGNTPSFTVADLSRVWVIAQISGSDLASIAVGDPADVLTGVNSDHVSGTVDNISALVNPDTRAVMARVVVQNPGNALKKQMYVRVLVHSRQENTGMLVPVAAILRDDENLPFIYVAQRDGSFARHHVTLGYRTGDQYEIPEGLKADEQIVTDGAIFMQFMQTQ